MVILVNGNEVRVQELRTWGLGHSRMELLSGAEGEPLPAFDLYIDLDFDEEPEAGIRRLSRVHGKPCILASVSHPVGKVPAGDNWLIGLNAWPGMLNRKIAEISLADPATRKDLGSLFSAMDREFILVQDQLGMVTPRILSRIINEAYFAAADGTAVPKDIDTAMKLGAHYPNGPFLWSERIGPGRISGLLNKLHASTGDDRYLPAPLLEQKAERLGNPAP